MTVHHFILQGLERVLLTKYLSAGFLDTVIKAVSKQIEAQGQLYALVTYVLWFRHCGIHLNYILEVCKKYYSSL